jgi:hypothetical protein
MTSLAKTFFLVAATIAYAFCGFSLAGDDAPIRINGCDLLSSPSEYNGKLVRVHGLVHSDFEHFDLRFKCKGYIHLETSTSDAEVKKFGFRTREDGHFKELLKGVHNEDTIGPNCLQCSSNKRIVHATVDGLFRCHYDFPDCANVSTQGDSSLVVLSVQSVEIKTLLPVTSPH